MQIVWDERKRLANLVKPGLDFADLDLEFFSTAVIRPAKLGRFRAIGAMRNSIVAVIFVRLGSQGLAVISMRPANLRERRELA